MAPVTPPGSATRPELRVAMVCGVREGAPCGVLDHTLQLLLHLNGAGTPPLRYELLVNEGLDPERKADLAARGVETVQVGGVWSPMAIHRTVDRLGEPGRYHLVHVQYPARGYGHRVGPSALPGALRVRRVGLPLVLTLHEFGSVGRLRRLATLPLVMGARRILVTTPGQRAGLAGPVPSVADRIRIVGLGPNIPVSAPPQPAQDRPQGPVQLVFFGIIRPDKGFGTLLEALSRLDDAAGAWRLTVSGRPAGGLDLSALLAGALGGRAGRVDWKPDLAAPQVSALLRSADLCVLPFADGASFRRSSLIAALTHATPVLTTDAGDAPPELVHGENAWMVPPGDAAALARALRRLLAAPDLRRNLGDAAGRLAPLFHWDRHEPALRRAYLEALG